MQSLLRIVFPPQCIACGAMVERDFGLCGTCWRDTPFITGLVCDCCGVPLPGDVVDDLVHCDTCMSIARPWQSGRAAVQYKDQGRSLVLALKHGDRLDLAKPLAGWMSGVAEPLLREDTVLVPIPAHPLRLIKRRYNQAAVLSNALSSLVGRPTIPDLLQRVRQTASQDDMTLEQRFQNMADAIKPSKYGALKLAGRPVLLVDDVVTSGATMAAAAEACHALGARRVDILSLARVGKDA